MPAVHADLSISSRWVLPMTARDAVLENHTLVVRDGRIIDLLPNALATTRYAASVHVDRSHHVVLPGLVNAQTGSGAFVAGAGAGADQVRDAELLGIARMLRSGTTCFCNMGYFPEESLRTAVAQGMRALIGIPIAEVAGTRARTPGEYLTRALRFRDEVRDHPTMTTAFAPHASVMSDSLFARIATLANELDASIVMSLHESAAEIDESVARHGRRPIDRMHALGLLTPAFTAVHMVHIDDDDLAIAQRSGISIALCPESNLRSGHGQPPITRWAATGLRLGLGSGTDDSSGGLDLWSTLRLLALLSRSTAACAIDVSAWEAICVATRGGAACLGLDTEIGTLEIGKWADLCCIDLRNPALLPANAIITQLVFNGSRDMVSDVWIAGRHLLEGGAFTRLDWPELAARLTGADRPNTGYSPP